MNCDLPGLRERYVGALLGLATGDAVGTTVEFSPRGTFEPITDMVGGGPFDLAPGRWTDDTSMALCLAESLLERSGFDARDQMARYVNWWQWGYWSSTGVCFDIGGTVSAALSRFIASGEAFAGSAEPRTAGNGSLMRLAPVVLYFYPSLDEVLHYAEQSSRTTHAAPEAVECCRLFARLITKALQGSEKNEILDAADFALNQTKVKDIAAGGYRAKARDAIVGSGYSVASLEAALWCFDRTDSYETAVLEAVNLGDDADTTAAIVGQLAGAHYGASGIPLHWRQRLHLGDEIEAIADRLLNAAGSR
jgi:ADP-ribosyl-[dinitrogen reductase] hydrolase